MSELGTLQETLSKLADSRHQPAGQPTVVLDAGIASEANLTSLPEQIRLDLRQPQGSAAVSGGGPGGHGVRQRGPNLYGPGRAGGGRGWGRSASILGQRPPYTTGVGNYGTAGGALRAGPTVAAPEAEPAEPAEVEREGPALTITGARHASEGVWNTRTHL